MAARFHPTAGRRRRGVVLGVMALLAVLLSRPLAGPAPTVQAQDQRIHFQPYTHCVAHGIPIFTVPAGVTQLRLEVQGATGGFGDDGLLPHGFAGRGAWVGGNVPVTPGQQLRIYVGCTGQREGAPDNGHGYTNGGSRGRARGASVGSGGTGGGSSAVTTAAGEVLIVAGGGGAAGGGGLTGAGGDGGDASIRPQPGEGGHGPGSGDGGCAICVGGQMAGAGTDSSVTEDGGGGGGGGAGWCGNNCSQANGGGGHGADEGGGGGGGGGAGNSFAASSVTNTSFQTSSIIGDGQITISWATNHVAPGPTTPAPPPPSTRCSRWSGPLALIIPWQNCTG